MGASNYYLLSYIPPLSYLDGAPDFSCAAFMEYLDPDERPHRLCRAILLSDDLLQRQAVLCGELENPTPAVLNELQLRDEAPLPEELLPDGGAAPRKVAEDAIWDAYFHYAHSVAAAEKSTFLKRWIGFEVALRNTLAEDRARDLGLEPTDYLVAEALGEPDVSIPHIANDVNAADNPIAVQRALDEGRWEWLDFHDPFYSFDDDELAAYAARLMLTLRWSRLDKAKESKIKQNI